MFPVLLAMNKNIKYFIIPEQKLLWDTTWATNISLKNLQK
jgi:hypothetical protein